MFHAFLAFEHLAVVLLIWTLLTAATARCGSVVRTYVRLLAGLALFAWVAALAGAWAMLATFFPGTNAGAFVPPALFALGFLIAAPIIVQRVRSDWPLGRIALVTAVAVAIHVATWANLQNATAREIASLRQEAGNLALSVAPPAVSDRENAAVRYQEIFDAMGTYVDWAKEWEGMNHVDEQPADPADEGKGDVHSDAARKFFAAKRQTIESLRKAAAMPGCRFEHDYVRPTPDTLLPEIQSLREASRLLAADAKAHFVAGRVGEAVKNLDAMWRMAEHAASEPYLISFLVGAAIERNAIATLEWGLGQGTFGDKSVPPLALEHSGLAVRIRLHRALACEEAMGVLACCDLAEGQSEMLAPELRFPLHGAGVSALSAAYRILPFFSEDVAMYRHGMRRGRRMMEMQDLRLSAGLFDKEFAAKDRQGLIARLLVPAHQLLSRHAVQAGAPRETACVGLAIFRHELKYGKPPAALEELVPEYLEAVPRDPFAKGPFRYLPAEKGRPWVVYSIGADGVDGGGQRLQGSGEGDIVFSPRVRK